MVMLTGGEKYNTKQIIIKISEIYPSIKEIVADEKYFLNPKSSYHHPAHKEQPTGRFQNKD